MARKVGQGLPSLFSFFSHFSITKPTRKKKKKIEKREARPLPSFSTYSPSVLFTHARIVCVCVWKTKKNGKGRISLSRQEAGHDQTMAKCVRHDTDTNAIKSRQKKNFFLIKETLLKNVFFSLEKEKRKGDPIEGNVQEVTQKKTLDFGWCFFVVMSTYDIAS